MILEKKICKDYNYEYSNKLTKEIKLCTLFVIINLLMAKNLINNSIQQYFCDCTYHCIPPTLRKYKMFVIYTDAFKCAH